MAIVCGGAHQPKGLSRLGIGKSTRVGERMLSLARIASGVRPESARRKAASKGTVRVQRPRTATTRVRAGGVLPEIRQAGFFWPYLPRAPAVTEGFTVETCGGRRTR